MRNNDTLRQTITRAITFNTSIIIIVYTKINRDSESDDFIHTS